jgi:hypothetical protein
MKRKIIILPLALLALMPSLQAAVFTYPVGLDVVFSGSVTVGAAGVKLTGDGDGAITFLGAGNGSDEDLTLNLDDTANTGVFSSSTGLATLSFSSINLTSPTVTASTSIELSHATANTLTASGGVLSVEGVALASATAPVFTTSIKVGSAGVLFSDDGDGAITLLGAGDGFDEDIKLNLDDAENTLTITSSTGVTSIDLGTIGLATSGDLTVGTLNVTTLNTASQVFEGATPDGFETTLTVTDPTADRTFTLPNASGTAALINSDVAQVLNFGGDTSLEIPNGADPDITVEGQISYETDIEQIRGFDGTQQVSLARKIEDIQVTVTLPNDLADSERDAFWVWENVSGMSFVVTGWSAKSDTDDTTLNLEEIDGDGQNNATVDAVEIATNGTGLFYASDTTITAATIENGHVLVLDFDDTDTPGQVKIVVYGYFSPP